MKYKYKNLLINDYINFTREHITNTSKHLGITDKEAIESHLWVYEFFSQIQKRSGEKCVLKGGACAQLYMSMDSQRCTADLDASTSLNEKQIIELLYSIRHEFNIGGFYSSFSEYIPKSVHLHGKTIPMKTFLFFVPFEFKKYAKGKAPHIKMDFVFTDTSNLDLNYCSNEIVGLDKLKEPLICLTPYSIISDKLITFAIHSVGLPSYKTDSFYKNIYDLYYLINVYNDLNSFKNVSKSIENSVKIEIDLKKIPELNKGILFNDILHTLFKLSILDLRKDYKPDKRFVQFERNLLQQNIKNSLNADAWSLMIMYVFIWAYALKEYVLLNDYSKLSCISEITKIYATYITLSNKEKTLFITEFRKSIKSFIHSIYIDKTNDPMRIICLYYITQNFDIHNTLCSMEH